MAHVFIIAIIFKILAALLLSFWVLPIMFEESKVGNGLGWLRRVMLLMGVTILAVDLFNIVLLLIKLYNESNVVVGFMSFTNSVSVLLLSVLLYLIYNKRYYKK